MLLNPPIPRPLKLTAWFLLLQGVLSLAGTVLSVVQHRFSMDLTLASVLFGFGLLKLNKTVRWLTLASLVVQNAMCAWALRSVVKNEALMGENRLFSYLLVDVTLRPMEWIMVSMVLILTLQFIYLVLPSTRRLFKMGISA